MGTKDIWQLRANEIRVLVLFSLTLQIFLLFAGGLRKRRSDWWLRLLLWLAYLLADYIAIYTLGHLSQQQKLSDGSNDGELQLLVFWAPFLILHLGGQDTVTAFAVEDNELWLRHFLSLLSQVFLAGYVYLKSHPDIRLMRPAIIMFVAGVIKYGERTLALRAASMGSLRSSMLTPPDPGPNYAKLVGECQSRRDAGLHADIVIVPERPPDGDDLHVEVKDYSDLVYNAHRFYQIFRRLFVDLILSFQDRIDSLAFFGTLEMEKAFKVVEIELVLMYESLHTKALVIHGWVGRGLRLCTLAAPVVSLVLFMRASGDMTASYNHKPVDIIVSYVLLAGAIFLELYAILLITVSPWTYTDLRAIGRLQRAADVVFSLFNWFYPEERLRWSNKMSQYNLISYCLKDKPRWYKRLMELLEWKLNFGVKTMWDNWRYTDEIVVSKQLKSLIFDQIKSKASSTKDPRSYRKLGEHRGQWVLQRKGLYHDLSWSVDCEFDESIILWHIATDLCFHHQYPAETEDEKCCGCSCNCLSKCFRCFCSGLGPDDDNVRGQNHCSPANMATMSRVISNYMLFLLVMRPFMMTAGIGQIRFRDTCAEAKNFFRRDDEAKGVKAYLLRPSMMTAAIRQFLSGGMCAATKNFFRREVKVKGDKASAKELMEVDTSIAEPRDVKGDRSKSVLFQACKLARQLLKLEEGTRWNLIASVWVEMLCYAAGKCSGNSHARQLSQGGELLTVVWLLMAHFGVGDQYRVESGHARAKLIVYN